MTRTFRDAYGPKGSIRSARFSSQGRYWGTDVLVQSAFDAASRSLPPGDEREYGTVRPGLPRIARSTSRPAPVKPNRTPFRIPLGTDSVDL